MFGESSHQTVLTLEALMRPIPANKRYPKIGSRRRDDAVRHVGDFGTGHFPHGFNHRRGERRLIDNVLRIG